MRVLQGAGRRELGAGLTIELPASAPAPAPAATAPAPPPAATAPAPAPAATAPAPAPAATAPAAPAEVAAVSLGAASRAAAVPSRVEPSAPAPARMRDGAALLLAAADRARRAGHPDAAMRPLRMLVARFPDDSRAPLAAFTLGLLALDRRRSEDAARSFALARRLDPAGELAEDALAREVQAWYEAGREGAARDRAAEYQRLYPDGRRAGSVRRLGGLR